MEQSHGHWGWGCRKSEEKRTFRGSADKGELKRLSVPGRCQGAAVGTGGREGGSEPGQWPGAPRGPGWVSGAPEASPHRPLPTPESPLHEGYSLTTSVSIRRLPGLGDDMVSPLPPRRLRRRRRLSSFPRRLSRAPGPGSEEPAAAPAPRWRWQHPRGPVGASQPPPRPPHGGTPGTVRPSGGGDPGRPARAAPLRLWFRRGPARPRRYAAPRDAPSSPLSLSRLLAAHPLAGSLAASKTSRRLQLCRPLYPSLALGAVTSPL